MIMAGAVLEPMESAEEAQPDRPESAFPEYGPTWAGVMMATLPVAVHALSSGAARAGRWFEVGSASAERILAGELWRTVTALTLHADLPHLLGNTAAGAVLFMAVCRTVGPVVGAWLILLAGAGGNALNALLHRAAHDAIGASTAVLGAVGVLSGAAAVRARRATASRARAWVPIAAGLALLAMLGAGKRTDLGAHLFGFLAGTALGIAAGLGVRRPVGRTAQHALALGAFATVAGCWFVAFAHG